MDFLPRSAGSNKQEKAKRASRLRPRLPAGGACLPASSRVGVSQDRRHLSCAGAQLVHRRSHDWERVPNSYPTWLYKTGQRSSWILHVGVTSCQPPNLHDTKILPPNYLVSLSTNPTCQSPTRQPPDESG